MKPSRQMKAGSAVIYLGSTFHAGGTNSTRSLFVRGLHVSYCLGWLRTEENQALATPLEVVRKLPERAQQLLGFGVHDDIEIGGGYLGTVDLESPHRSPGKGCSRPQPELVSQPRPTLRVRENGFWLIAALMNSLYE